jgi:hypothetical protein
MQVTEALRVSQVVVLVNAECHTAWNIRRAAFLGRGAGLRPQAELRFTAGHQQWPDDRQLFLYPDPYQDL